MNDHVFGILYGVVQGLTEFLPVSSSGHLALIPHFFQLKDPGVAFDLAMHVGTAMAVIGYFWKDLRGLFISTLRICTSTIKQRNLDEVQHHPFLLNLLVASGATFVGAMALKNLAAQYGRSPMVISLNLIVVGIIMWVVDIRAKNIPQQGIISQTAIRRSLLIGMSQSLAVWPGVSRSGATLTMARMLGISRREATAFSFLLGLPIILGGMLLKLKDFHQDISLTVCLVGIAVSFLVGLLAIHFFLKFVEKIGLVPFSIYRILLGFVLIFYFY